MVDTAQTRLLLVDRNEHRLKAVSRMLRPLVGELEAVESFVSPDSSKSFDLLIISYDDLEEADRARLNRWMRERRESPLNERQRVLYFSEAKSSEDLQRLFAEYALTNLLAREDELDGDDLIVTIQKIVRSDIFGLEKYFAWGVRPELFTTQTSNDKSTILARAEKFATAAGVIPRLCERFCSVADEFFTNAIYNAPTDREGRSRFADRSRTEQVQLDSDEAVEIKFCCDGRRLGISVTDPFGSLSPSRVLFYLAKCFRRDETQVDQKPGGAGLGFYQIFDSLSHFVINIAPSKKTEMVGLIDIRGSYRDFARKNKSFNVFVE